MIALLTTTIDSMAKKKARDELVKALKRRGVDVDRYLTENIEDKLDDLFQALIDDIGYIELVKIGWKL